VALKGLPKTQQKKPGRTCLKVKVEKNPPKDRIGGESETSKGGVTEQSGGGGGCGGRCGWAKVEEWVAKKQQLT